MNEILNWHKTVDLVLTFHLINVIKNYNNDENFLKVSLWLPSFRLILKENERGFQSLKNAHFRLIVKIVHAIEQHKDTNLQPAIPSAKIDILWWGKNTRYISTHCLRYHHLNLFCLIVHLKTSTMSLSLLYAYCPMLITPTVGILPILSA